MSFTKFTKEEQNIAVSFAKWCGIEGWIYDQITGLFHNQIGKTNISVPKTGIEIFGLYEKWLDETINKIETR